MLLIHFKRLIVCGKTSLISSVSILSTFSETTSEVDSDEDCDVNLGSVSFELTLFLHAHSEAINIKDSEMTELRSGNNILNKKLKVSDTIIRVIDNKIKKPMDI